MKTFKRGDKVKYIGSVRKNLHGKELVVVDMWSGKYEIYVCKIEKHFENIMRKDLVFF